MRSWCVKARLWDGARRGSSKPLLDGEQKRATYWCGKHMNERAYALMGKKIPDGTEEERSGGFLIDFDETKQWRFSFGQTCVDLIYSLKMLDVVVMVFLSCLDVQS